MKKSKKIKEAAASLADKLSVEKVLVKPEQKKDSAIEQPIEPETFFIHMSVLVDNEQGVLISDEKDEHFLVQFMSNSGTPTFRHVHRSLLKRR